MNETASSVFGDPELMELFAGEPELLAIADAVATTTPRRDVRRHASSSKGRPAARLVPHRKRWLIFAVAAAAVVAAVPALAFPGVRGFVGIDTQTRLPRAHYVIAKARVASIYKPAPYALTMARIRFTVGEPGKSPGTGVRGPVTFLVFLISNDQSEPFSYGMATGSHGYYQATIHVPKGGIRRIRIGGFMNASPSQADGGKFWIPVKVDAAGNF